MFRVLLPAAVAAVTVVVALSQSALADTVEKRAPGWSGFYVGANVTYAGGHNTGDTVLTRCCHDTATAGVSSFDRYQLKPDGWFAGGNIGFNWQMHPHWLVGLEADYSAGRASASRIDQTSSNLYFYSDNIGQKVGELGTVRGRLGWISGGTLLFVTGGVASARVTTTVSDYEAAPLFVFPPAWSGSGQVSERRYGWTLGGGVESRLTDAWSLKLEYLFVDLGSQQFSFVSSQPGLGNRSTVTVHTDISEHLLRFGVNYRFAGF
jgi:outer membrane immunogenic protein